MSPTVPSNNSLLVVSQAQTEAILAKKAEEDRMALEGFATKSGADVAVTVWEVGRIRCHFEDANSLLDELPVPQFISDMLGSVDDAICFCTLVAPRVVQNYVQRAAKAKSDILEIVKPCTTVQFPDHWSL